MGKRRHKDRSRSSSRIKSSKRKERSHLRSRDSSYGSSYDRSRSHRHSRDVSRSCSRSLPDPQVSPSEDLLTQILDKLTRQEDCLASIEAKASLEENHSLASDQHHLEDETVLQNRDSDPDVQFVENPSIQDKSNHFSTQEEAPPVNFMIDEFFDSCDKPSSDSPWPSAMFDFVRNIIRSGLEEDRRTNLLKQYEVKDSLAILGPPKLNKLLVPALKSSASIIKRDEYQALSQSQVAASLNAFGSAISLLLSPEIKHLLPEEAIPALRHLADGFHLLSDHQHRLSMARRAFIKPSLSLVGKNAVDNAPVDEWLFGTSFADNLKDAQACEKAARDLLRSAPVVTKPNPQPVRHPTSKQQPHLQGKQSGNAKAPARQPFSSARHAGVRRHSSRYKDRARSRSRRR